MSESMMDTMPRLKDYMKAEDLNTDGCVKLVAAIMREQAQDLTSAARRYNTYPSKENREHLEQCRSFYRSDLFKALSCGIVDGEQVMKNIIKDALRGRIREGRTT